MNAKKYFYIASFLFFALNCKGVQITSSRDEDSNFRSTSMILVEGGIIPKWSPKSFEKNLAELKEDPLVGKSVIYCSALIADLKNNQSKSIFQGEKVKAFLISDVETTWGEWQIVTDWAKKNGYKNLENAGIGSANNYPVRTNFINCIVWCNAKSEMEGLKPVYKINNRAYREVPIFKNSSGPKMIYFPDIDKSANGYRLPTEIEWEWAAIGGTKSKGYLFSGSNKPSEVAWHLWNSENTIEILKYTVPPYTAAPKDKNISINDYNKSWHCGTMPVAQKKPNELLLYDMTGNVAEICGEGVPRGGHYGNTIDPCANSPWKKPLKYNYKNIPYDDGIGNEIGFRLVRSIM